MMQILETDTKFYDSPAVGEPECLCSRCGKPILGGVPLRAWPNDMTEDPATQWEYRYHNACQGLNPEFDRAADRQHQELEDCEFEKYFDSAE